MLVLSESTSRAVCSKVDHLLAESGGSLSISGSINKSLGSRAVEKGESTVENLRNKRKPAVEARQLKTEKKKTTKTRRNHSLDIKTPPTRQIQEKHSSKKKEMLFRWLGA